MISLQENASLFFNGTAEPAAMVSVDLYGKAETQAYEQMTKAITQIIEKELAISPKRIFIKYGEYHEWGWNNTNF